MKKAVFILIVLILSLLYYLGIFTRKETFPFSKEFFSVESSPSGDHSVSLPIRMKDRGSPFPKISSLTSKEWDQLYQLKLDQGVRNIPLLSLVLIREATEDRRAGRPDKAVEGAGWAVKFSPDLPEPYFELARALWSQNPFQVLRPFSETWKGVRAGFGYYPRALQFFYNLFYILGNAVLMTFVVFGIILLVKYLPLYVYDIRKNLSREVDKLLANSLKIFLLFIPFFLRLDILWAVLYYLILFWGFVAKRERQLIVFFFIVLVYVPFFLRSSSSFLDSSASDILMEMNAANYEDGSRTVEESLKSWLSTHPDDPEVIFTLGLLEKRQSRYAQAEEYYRKAIQVAPVFSEAFSNLGNVYYARRQTGLALSSYQHAIELNPSKGAYYYNLYRALSQETFLSGNVGLAFQKAMQLDPKLVQYYSSIDTPPHPNRLVVDEMLSARVLWTRFLSFYIGREGILFRLFKAWFERVPSRLPILVPLFFLGFVVGMSKFGRARRFLTRCPMCGSPTHRFYLGNTAQEYICFNCYRIYIQKEKLHPKIAEKKALQIQQFQKQNDFLRKFLSFFFVGLGDLWGDRSLRGLVLLFVFFAFALRFIFWNGVIPSTTVEPFLSLGKLIFWVGAFGLFYYIILRQVMRAKRGVEAKRGALAAA